MQLLCGSLSYMLIVCFKVLDLHSKYGALTLLERRFGPNLLSIPSSRPLSEVPRLFRLISRSVVCLGVRLLYVSDWYSCSFMLDLHSKIEPTVLIERWMGPTLCSVLSSRPLSEVPQLFPFISRSAVCLCVRLLCVSDWSSCLEIRMCWTSTVKLGLPSL